MNIPAPAGRKRLHTAVIGCGAIGTRHAHAIAHSEDAVLTAVCDVDAERAQAVAVGTEARLYTDMDALLQTESLDVITVATPDHLHTEPVVKALEAGCHVFCEKPLAMTMVEARHMAEIAKRCGRQLTVDYNRRFAFGYAKAWELLSQRRIGTVRHAVLRVTDGVPRSALERGPYAMLFTLLTHHIDLMRCMCGEVCSVHARCAGKDESGLFCEVALSLGFASGAVGTLLGGWRKGQTRTVEWAEVGGTQGAILIEDVQRRVRLHGLNPDRTEEFLPDPFQDEETTFYGSLTAHVRQFLACIHRGDVPPVSAEDGVRGLEIVAAAIKSHTDEATVSV